MGEGGLEIDAALMIVAGFAFGDAQEGLDLPEIGLGGDDCLKEGEGLIVVAMEEEEDAEVGADFEVGGVEGECGLQLGDGEVGVILMEIGLRLLEVGGEGLLVGRGLRDAERGWRRAEPIPWKDVLALGTYCPDDIESEAKEFGEERKRRRRCSPSPEVVRMSSR